MRIKIKEFEESNIKLIIVILLLYNVELYKKTIKY